MLVGGDACSVVVVVSMLCDVECGSVVVDVVDVLQWLVRGRGDSVVVDVAGVVFGVVIYLVVMVSCQLVVLVVLWW